MAHVDDWGSTDSAERKRLEASCADPLCGSPRYAHGTITNAPSNIKTVTYTPGPCTIRPCGSNCQEFKTKPPITADEIIDVAEFFKREVRLMDLGIDTARECGAYVVQFEGNAKKKSGYCHKDKNHEGAHDPVWSTDVE